MENGRMTRERYTPSTYGDGEDSGSVDGPNPSFFTQRSVPAPATSSQFARTERHVKEMRSDLGLLERFRFDRESQQIIRRQLGEIFVILLEGQKQQLLSKLALELDAAKKLAFYEHMRQNSKIEKEIAKLSTEYEADLIDYCWDFGEEYWKRKKARICRLGQARAAGQIDEQDYEWEAKRVESWAMRARENLDAKIELMLRNHAKQIERTLQVFHERNINGPR